MREPARHVVVEERADPPAEPIRDAPLDDAREAITNRGRERGFVTSDDLLEMLPDDDLSPEQIEEFLSRLEDHLREEGIEVIEVPGEEAGDGAGARLPSAKELKTPSYDPVRMYLKDIGRVSLLTAAQEVDLAMRIEAGEIAAELLVLIADSNKVDQKRFRKVIEAVVRIRTHQFDPE